MIYAIYDDNARFAQGLNECKQYLIRHLYQCGSSVRLHRFARSYYEDRRRARVTLGRASQRRNDFCIL